MTDYCTAAQVKDRLNVTGSTYDALLAEYATAVSRWIDQYCRLPVDGFAVAGDSTRYYQPYRIIGGVLHLDMPCLSVTTLTNGNGNANQNDNVAPNGNVNVDDGDALSFSADLDGGQETPPVDTDAAGTGTATLSEDETTIDFLFTATGLSGPVTAAHFHEAPPGVAGGIVIDLGADLSQVGDLVTLEGSAAVDADFVTALRNGDIYVNLHTDENPAGEIRGQLEVD